MGLNVSLFMKKGEREGGREGGQHRGGMNKKEKGDVSISMTRKEILNLLSRFPPTFTTCTTLLSLAVDAFGYSLFRLFIFQSNFPCL